MLLKVCLCSRSVTFKGSIEKVEAVAATQGHALCEQWEQAADVLVHSQSIGGLGTGGEGATEGGATKSVVSISFSKVVVVLGTI